jgi:polar amino acid transport system substrate-binding protein
VQAQATLAQARETGTLRLGYLPGARPLTWRNDSGAPEGYAISLCRLIAEAVRLEAQTAGLKVDFVPLNEDPVEAIRAGASDMSCTPVQATLSRRASADFSIPVMPGGTGILVRRNVSPALRNLLEGARPARNRSGAARRNWRSCSSGTSPSWRGPHRHACWSTQARGRRELPDHAGQILAEGLAASWMASPMRWCPTAACCWILRSTDPAQAR